MTRKTDRPKPGREDAPTPPAVGAGRRRSGSPRPEDLRSVNLYDDEARWAKEVADDRRTRIADLLSPKIRDWLYSEWRAMRARKAKEAEAEHPPPPPGSGPPSGPGTRRGG